MGPQPKRKLDYDDYAAGTAVAAFTGRRRIDFRCEPGSCTMDLSSSAFAGYRRLSISYAIAVSCCWLLEAAGTSSGPAPGARSWNGIETAAVVRDEPRRVTMQLTSSAFSEGQPIPRQHTCDGEDSSPPLRWSGAPEGTRSFALIMDDPDAPVGTWVHWVLYDLPAGTQELGRGLPKKEKLDSGAAHGLCWGVSSFQRVGYQGPCPPPGKPHRYVFQLYALDEPLGLAPRATKTDVLRAAEGHVLAEARLVGTYKR